tara:strand:+ start:5415 stop:5921 length:507 start_codon:yes stop_codon:yes gene_type:complete
MTIQAITTFIRVFDTNNVQRYLFQNSKTDANISYQPDEASCFDGNTDSLSYPYLPFIYNGATKSNAGDNLESFLTLAVNELSLSRANEFVQNSYSVEVFTVLMDAETFAANRTLTVECWMVSGMTYDVQGVQLRLSTAIDAIASVTPNKVLRTEMVGALPVSSRISNA